jgi:hypothetical protein
MASKNERGIQMQDNHGLMQRGALGLVATIFGVLAGLGGLTHGIGEVLQGDVKPDGIIINSWTKGPIATHMGGEPGMTIVPNLLVTGALTIFTSLAVLAWATLFVHKKRGGWVLMLLSTLMMLVGGGFGPPIIGILAGAAGTGINAPHAAWRRRLSVKVRRSLARLWPLACAVSVINGVFLVVGSVILVYLVGFHHPDLFTNSFFFAVLSLPATILTGIAHDIEQGERIVRSRVGGVGQFGESVSARG